MISKGRANILKIISSLPATKVEESSIVFDAWEDVVETTNVLLVFVNGNYAELPEGKNLRSFSRSFVLTPASEGSL